MSVNTLLNCCTATALFAMQGKKVGFLSVYIVSFFPYNGLSAHFFFLVPPGLFSFTSSFTFVLFFFFLLSVLHASCSENRSDAQLLLYSSFCPLFTSVKRSILYQKAHKAGQKKKTFRL